MAALLSLAFAVSGASRLAAEDKPAAEGVTQRETAIRKLAPSLTLDFRIVNPPFDNFGKWATSARGKVKIDGTAEASVRKRGSKTTTPELHEGRLDDAQRRALLAHVIDGLGGFTINARLPESDEADVQMNVSVGSAKFATRGCFDRFAVGPARYLAGILPMKGAPEKVDAAPPAEVAPEAEARPADTPIVLRRTRRRLIVEQLSEWKVRLEIFAAKTNVLRITLNERGYLYVTVDEAAFPALVDKGRTLDKADRDRMQDLFARAIEGFAICMPSPPNEDSNKARRTCKLSFETPCYGFAISEGDFDRNAGFAGDIQKLLDAIADLKAAAK